VTAVEGVVNGEFGQLGTQALGALVLCTVMFGVAFAFFKIQNAVMTGGIRPPADEELTGLDLREMGVLAYPEIHDLEVVTGLVKGDGDTPAEETETAPV
jgi:ammonia channel protein AmtB